MFFQISPSHRWCLDQHHYLRLARKANVTYSEESIIACRRNFARLRSQRIRETIKVRINMQICLLVSRETQAQGRDRNPRRIKSEGLLAQSQVLGSLSASYVGDDLAYLNIEISLLRGAKNPEPAFGQVSREKAMCQYYTTQSWRVHAPGKISIFIHTAQKQHFKYYNIC